jgi:hypothetical protein
MTRFYPYPFFSDNCLFSFPEGRPLWREDGSVTYSAIADWSGHWWPITIQYRLIWDCSLFVPSYDSQDYGGGSLTRHRTESPTWRARSPYLYPPGTGWPSYTPRHWVPFCRLLRLTGLRWKYSLTRLHTGFVSHLSCPFYIGLSVLRPSKCHRRMVWIWNTPDSILDLKLHAGLPYNRPR